jgi:antitoxin (DNA-binding transcriptional repressor) of toxin-antitoxin stability system
MGSFIDIAEAQARLPELIAKLIPGEELCITQNGHTIAKLLGVPPWNPKPRVPGSAVGKLIIHEDDDSHLADFKEYME